MIDIKIKITGIGCWDEETPLELSLEDARKLYEELGKVFERPIVSYEVRTQPFGVESATLPKKETP